MATARAVWPEIPADFTGAKSPVDDDWFAFDATDKLAERSASISGTPTFAAYLPDAPTTPTTDLTFGSVAVTANAAGLAGQVVNVKVSGGTEGLFYKVTMHFLDTAGRTLDRSQLLEVRAR